jgi:YHS domain-containing protein
MLDVKKKVNCPVCNMEVDMSTGLKTEYQGHSYYFCSENDKNKFIGNPEKYIRKEHAAKAA